MECKKYSYDYNYLLMNQIFELNNPARVDMPFNQTK